jgi:hypothetical protein
VALGGGGDLLLLDLESAAFEVGVEAVDALEGGVGSAAALFEAG